MQKPGVLIRLALIHTQYAIYPHKILGLKIPSILLQITHIKRARQRLKSDRQMDKNTSFSSASAKTDR